jgi:hypothetical protein
LPRITPHVWRIFLTLLLNRHAYCNDSDGLWIHSNTDANSRPSFKIGNGRFLAGQRNFAKLRVRERACPLFFGHGDRVSRYAAANKGLLTLRAAFSHFRELCATVDGVKHKRSVGNADKQRTQNKMRRVFLIGMLCGVIITAAVTFEFAIPANSDYWRMEIWRRGGGAWTFDKKGQLSWMWTVEPIPDTPSKKRVTVPSSQTNVRTERL